MVVICGDIVPWRLFTTWRTQKFLQTVCSLFFMLQLFNSLFGLARSLLFSTQLLLPPSRFPTAKNKTTPRAAAAAAFYDAVIELCCCLQETLQEKHFKKNGPVNAPNACHMCFRGFVFFIFVLVYRFEMWFWRGKGGGEENVCLTVFIFFFCFNLCTWFFISLVGAHTQLLFRFWWWNMSFLQFFFCFFHIIVRKGRCEARR